MSGHSHWSTIKHKKGTMDAKRGKIFSKISRLISIAAKEKGGDPDSNPQLRMAIEKAREANMPKDNIIKAIKKGTGELEGDKIEQIIYEAYGPSGIAIIIEGITDNKNRTLSEIKHILSIFGGKLAQVGSVKYMFDYQNGKWISKYPFEITDEKSRKQIVKLFEALDENDDIQEIYSNLKS
ncbi:YebC/PmpR family DNA-binding transcriptional regulator [Patescibacteria group bacterium]